MYQTVLLYVKSVINRNINQSKMKDPAVLIYIDKWISSTNGMKSMFRAWYMDLLMYQYDNPKGIPDDIDTIAGICRVLPSEYQMLEQMLEQVLKQKFTLTEGFYVNNVASEIISKRQNFKEKRAKSGNIGVIIKLAKSLPNVDNSALDQLKVHLYNLSSEEIEKAKDEQVLKQMLKLYINVDEDEDIYNNSISNSTIGEIKIRQNNFSDKEAAKKILKERPSVLDRCKMKNNLSIEQVLSKIDEFIDAKIDWEENDWKTEGDLVKNFEFWLAKNSHTVVNNFKNWTSEEFKNEVGKFQNTFSKKMLTDFLRYYRQETEHGKMRFQELKAWNTEDQLKIWKANEK